ncbi:MAG: flagellar motor switch protein FliG [Rhizobiales bacterium]|nr:flagellar motor switch protein FliG [Hyphomicrobiales bacterium]
MSTQVAEIRPQSSSHRSSTEKVAILLASLDNSLAIELLKKLGAEDAKHILESSANLGPLTSGDVVPLVDEFANEFADALGISASRQQLMALLEAAFTSEEIASFLGRPTEKPSTFSWSRFTMGMESTLVPYLLDEHPQTAAYILSRLSADLAARCIELLPAALRASVTARLLRIEDVKKPVLDVLERVLQEDLFGERAAAAGGNDRLERLANIINRLDRAQADAIITDIIKINPEDGAALRKLIFMFEDIPLLEQQHRAKLLDRVSTDLIIAALFGAEAELREAILSSLSARTRRMVESELPQGESQPRKDTVECRRKIAEAAIQAAKNGDITLPDTSAAPEAGAAA